MNTKVLHVIAYPPYHIGGCEFYVHRLAKAQQKLGLTPVILSTDLEKPNFHITKFDGLFIINLRNSGTLANMNPLFNPIPFLRKNKDDYDIIHVHSYIHFSSIITVLWCYFNKKKCVLTLHGGVKTKDYQAKTIKEHLLVNFKNYIFDRIIGRFTLTFPTAVISVSKQDLLEIGNVFNARRKMHNYFIPNAVSNVFHDYGIPLDIAISNGFDFNKKERKYLTFIGRLSFIKGFDLFLKIAKRINEIDPSIPFLIIGKGEMENLIDEYKDSINLTHIRSAYIKNIYDQTRLYILTSRAEGLPTTILEAMVTKTPVVSTNVGGIVDVIKDKENGRIINAEDIEGTTQLIYELINDKKSLDKYTENGYNLIQKKFSIDKMTKDVNRVYKKIG